MLYFFLLFSFVVQVIKVYSDNDDSLLRVPVYYKGKSFIKEIWHRDASNELKTHATFPHFDIDNFKMHNNSGEIIEILQNILNLEYCGEISIGNPNQKFLVTFSTRTSNLWVPSIHCKTEQCVSHGRYNSSASSTHEGNGTIVNIKGISGLLAEDSICVSRTCARKQFFVEATSIEIDKLSDDKRSGGVLGLAPTRTTSLGITSFFQTLIDQKLINMPVFAFWLKRDVNNTAGGEITIGGIDTRRYYDPISWCKITDPNKWKIKMDGIKINSSVVGCLKGCQVEVQSDTPFMIGPVNDTDMINKLVGFDTLQFPYGNIYYISNCTKDKVISAPNISLVIEEKEFTLNYKDYIWYQKDGVSCLSTFVGLNIEEFNDWIIGAPFIGRYYTIFDFGRKNIGFAKSKEEVLINPLMTNAFWRRMLNDSMKDTLLNMLKSNRVPI